jgi:hypothetical protein
MTVLATMLSTTAAQSTTFDPTSLALGLGETCHELPSVANLDQRIANRRA